MLEASRGTVIAWAVAAVLGTLALLRVFGGGEDAGGSPVKIDGPDAAGQETTGTGGGEASGGSGGSAGDRQSAGVYVHVAGAVKRPGLLRVAPGTRVAQALDRAGGPTRKADLDAVNLAAKLEDGQQIVVPVAGAAPTATPGTAASGSTGAKPSLGSASVEQLDQVDGIGPTLAARIVEYRQEHGGFRSLDELREVDGIGEKRLEALRDGLQP
jgi:competence protein ComEA